jgi:hypothetical protein
LIALLRNRRQINNIDKGFFQIINSIGRKNLVLIS